MVNLKKFTPEDILIVGDSFCSSRHNDYDWPILVTRRLVTSQDNKFVVRGKGLPGASWWSTRKNLLKELKIKLPKVLIITHTEPQRIPSDSDYSLNGASVFDSFDSNASEKIPKEVRLAGQAYYKHLLSTDFHIWAQLHWFLELDGIIEQKKIPHVIHMHSFKPWWNEKFHIFKHGVTFKEALWDNCDDCLLLQKYKKDLDNKKVTLSELQIKYGISNHLNKDKNIALADAIYNSIINGLSGSQPLSINNKKGEVN